MDFVDTHCHIQEARSDLPGKNEVRDKWLEGGEPDQGKIIAEAQSEGVTRLVCVGCTLADSQRAVELAQASEGVWASIGLHPHEARRYQGDTTAFRKFSQLARQSKVVAVGECGLDFYYNNSPRAEQEKVLRFQIELAQECNLPMIFHVRNAFREFWPIFDQYPGVRGVIHSFSSSKEDLEQILARGLYVGLNGIMTFTKDAGQIAAARGVPLQKMLLETDAPYLTPMPLRGKICVPKHVRLTAQFLSDLRGESLEEIAVRTTQNAQALFNFK